MKREFGMACLKRYREAVIDKVMQFHVINDHVSFKPLKLTLENHSQY